MCLMSTRVARESERDPNEKGFRLLDVVFAAIEQTRERLLDEVPYPLDPRLRPKCENC